MNTKKCVKDFKAELYKFKKWLDDDESYYLVNSAKPNGETYSNFQKINFRYTKGYNLFEQ